MVLIREDNMPRMKWLVEADGMAIRSCEETAYRQRPRAADLNTFQGQRTRAIQRSNNLGIGECKDCNENVMAENRDVSNSSAVKDKNCRQA